MKPLAKLTYLALLSSLFFWIPPGQADDVTLDFEDQALQTAAQLVISTPQLIVTISRPGTTFEIEDPNAASFGQRTLSPGSDHNGNQFVVNFSAPVSSVTFEVGDFSFPLPDVDELSVAAYAEADAIGDPLQTEITHCCGDAGFSSATITITAPGIKSIAFIGGSDFSPNSVFYDNFVFTLENQVVDQDQDGVADNVDTCKGSDLSQPVSIAGCATEAANATWETGCTTSDYLMACANNARNHGYFVNCVQDFAVSLADLGFITSEQKSELQSCAAQANLP